MINNLSDLVDSETLLAQLSFIKDAKEIVKLKKQEDDSKPTPLYTNNFNQNQIPDANAEEEEEEPEEIEV